MAIAETLAHLPSARILITPKTLAPRSSTRLTGSWRIAFNPRVPPPTSSSEIGASAAADHCRRLVNSFDPSIPLPEAVTPPASWYTDHSFLALEFDRVFFRGWQAVGFTEQIKNAHDFFTGRKIGSGQFLRKDRLSKRSIGLHYPKSTVHAKLEEEEASGDRNLHNKLQTLKFEEPRNTS